MSEPKVDSVEPLLERALAHAQESKTATSLHRTIAWDSPAMGKLQQADVTYRIDSDDVFAEVASVQLALAEPVRLLPIAIPKPWGQELWHTGMEARGESRVEVGEASLPLSQYLALAPGWLHRREPIVLLKILDPDAEPVRGDLYFEVHAQKQEVYVVTAVDQQAWPEGIGAIRYGVNQPLRRSYANDEAFRADYLAAVQAYEAVRRTLDGEAQASSAEDAQLAQACQGSQPEQGLSALERERRQAMERFTQVIPLAVGDIVRVPPWHPHALQHGVQVVEFQTPTYERYIISFAQKVLTQDHWDSAKAIEAMSLEALDPALRSEATSSTGVTRIASYSEFSALRVALTPDRRVHPLPKNLPYLVAICIRGEVCCGKLVLKEGESAFVPGCGLERGVQVTTTADDSLILLAAPAL